MKKPNLVRASLFVLLCAAVGAGIVAFSSFAAAKPLAEKAPLSPAASAAPQAGAAALPKVYFTKDISPAGLAAAYKALGRPLTGRVAVKLSTGEPGGNYYLNPALIKDLVRSVNGTIVECNTAYGGKRASTAMHKQVAVDHGFAAIAKVDIMDEDGSLSLPFPRGVRIKEDLVGAHFADYDSFLVLSHFKGHAMGGFGGALKNISIGIGSAEGKMWIHTAGATRSVGDFRLAFSTPQDSFLESMAEAAGAVMDRLGDRIIYVSVMNNLSVDCDCSSNPAKPEMGDIGILSSLDPVALDKACVDLVYAADQAHSAALRQRMESRHAAHILEHAQELGLGSQKYELVRIDG